MICVSRDLLIIYLSAHHRLIAFSYNSIVCITPYSNPLFRNTLCFCRAPVDPVYSLLIYLIHLRIDSKELLPPPILALELISTGCHLSAPAPIGVDSPNPFLTPSPLRPQRFLNPLIPQYPFPFDATIYDVLTSFLIIVTLASANHADFR